MMAEMAAAQGPVAAGTVALREREVLDLQGEITPIGALLGNLWRRRGLLPMLATKDFHSRYRSATFGVAWSVLLPIVQGAVLAVVFTHIVKINVGSGDNYPSFVVTGNVLFAYFATSLGSGSTTIVDGGGIAGKVYFPRLILPAVPATANMVGFVISMVVTLVLVPILGGPIQATLMFLPLAMLLLAALTVVLSELCSVAHVYFRDVRYMVQAVLTVLFYATPVIYPLDRPHGWLRTLITLNPVTGVIQLSRYAVFGHAPSLAPSLLCTAVFLVLATAVTLVAYRRYERIACDRL